MRFVAVTLVLGALSVQEIRRAGSPRFQEEVIARHRLK